MERHSLTSEDSNTLNVTAIRGKVSAEGICKNTDEPVVNCLAVSQTQRYFAVGTTTGFEIIQNDSNMTIKKLK